MTVRQMLMNMDSREITEWQIFFKLQNEDRGEETELSKKILGTFGGTTGLKVKKGGKK